MMLHEFVRRFPDDWQPRPSPYPAECQMAGVRRRIDDEAEVREARLVPIDLETLKQRLIDCAETGAWNTLSARHWRGSCECLCLGTPRLLDDPGFVATYLWEFETSRAFPMACDSLARWALLNFAPDHPSFAAVAAFLGGHLGVLRPRWRALHERHSVFDPELAAGRIAADFLSSTDSVAEFAARCGYTAAAVSSPLFAFAFVAACRMTADAPTPPTLDLLQRLSAWGISKRRLRYPAVPKAQAGLAEALLLPWRNGYPGEGIRTFVVRLLIGAMGDPRTRAPDWLPVGAEARDVMLRWMTRDALEQFLDIVDQTVQAHQLRMWGARRAFWLSFDEAHQIQESWVVFGRRGAAVARTIAAQNDQPALAHFGTLVRDVGGDPTQAVLIMKIGTLTVADWSHNGRCCIWRTENPAKPVLYKSEYMKEELLQRADFETPHYREWQHEIRNYIRPTR